MATYHTPFHTQIYADTSEIREIFSLYEHNRLVMGFTTNPSLMRKAGITDYTGFIKEVTNKITDLPLSFEIFADEEQEMEYQIEKLAGFADNIYVKVPVMNTRGISTIPLIEKMTNKGIKLNVTAVFDDKQIQELFEKGFNDTTPAIISIFAGRIADTGVFPGGKMHNAVLRRHVAEKHNVKILWASVREVYNIYEARNCHCDIITVTPDLIDKYKKFSDKNLIQFSRETVEMFYNDAKSSGLTL